MKNQTHDKITEMGGVQRHRNKKNKRVTKTKTNTLMQLKQTTNEKRGKATTNEIRTKKKTTPEMTNCNNGMN